jgi:hypothetical protein
MSTTHPTPSKRAWTQLPILLIPLALITACWTANGCGVTGQTVRLDVALDRTGTLSSDGNYSPTSSGNPIVGDTVNNLEIRAFLSLVLAPIPTGVNISKVTLHLEGASSLGNPFGDFGPLRVDHVDVGAGIDPADFDGGGLTTTIASIPTLPMDMSMVVELDITPYVQADLAAQRPTSTFRFRFNSAPTVENQADYAVIVVKADDPARQPFFATVTYQQP